MLHVNQTLALYLFIEIDFHLNELNCYEKKLEMQDVSVKNVHTYFIQSYRTSYLIHPFIIY